MKRAIELDEREHLIIIAGLKARQKRIESKLQNFKNQMERGIPYENVSHGMITQKSNLRENHELLNRIESSNDMANILRNFVNWYNENHNGMYIPNSEIGKFIINETI